MPLDLAQIDAMILSTEHRIGAQLVRFQTPDATPWARDAIHRRLMHLRQDLDTYRRARSLIAEGEG